MDIQYRKQLDCILADEVNVKEIRYQVGASEKGLIELVFDRKAQTYSWHMEGIVTPAKDNVVLKLFALRTAQ